MTNKAVIHLFKEGKLSSLDQLRDWSSSRHTVFVGLDVEGVDTSSKNDKRVHSSVGFASLPVSTTNGFSCNKTDALPHKTTIDLAEQVKLHKIDAHALAQIGSRQSRPPKRLTGYYTEYFPFVEIHYSEKCGFEQDLVTRLLDIKEVHRDQDSGQAPDLLLVLFSWGGEFEAMNQTFPNIAQHFSRWVDVPEIIDRAPGDHPSLNDAMIWLKLDAPQYLQSAVLKHCPGMDAVRTLAVLVELLSAPAGSKLRFQPWRPKKYSRPKPPGPPRVKMTGPIWNLDDDPDFTLSDGLFSE